MSDLLREIDEELERERMLALWTKYQKPIVAGLALALLVTASWSAWSTHQFQGKVSRTLGLSIILGKDSQKDADKAEALTAFAREFPGTSHALLARLAAAHSMLDAGQKAEGLAALDALAQDPAASDLLRQYAGLLAAEAQIDDGDVAMLRQKLAPLAEEGKPWRFTARALLGTLYGKHGDYAKAQEIFRAIEDDSDAPEDMRQAAHDLAQYYASQG